MADKPVQPLHRLIRETGGYALASVAGLAMDMAVLALLVSSAGVQYLAAATISFLCGAVLVYVLSVRFVFSVRRFESRTLELSSFVAVGLAGLLVNALIMYLAVTVAHVHFAVGKLAAAGCTFTVNFLLRRGILFSLEPAARARAG
jgi:putative flippase GtrA